MGRLRVLCRGGAIETDAEARAGKGDREKESRTSTESQSQSQKVGMKLDRAMLFRC